MAAYRTISEYFCGIFGKKMQKIPVNAGLGCPNRDGTLGTGGCIYCNNASFSPRYSYGSDGSITKQIDEGIAFFKSKNPDAGFLAYFQSYSNTYATVETLERLYDEALGHSGIDGLVIATRPDCLGEDILDMLDRRFGSKAPAGHPYLLVELGIESTSDATLERINRHHSFECAERAISELDRRDIAVGAHIILGLPGETQKDWTDHAEKLSRLPISTLKLHQLQVIKGTPLASMYERDASLLTIKDPGTYAGAVVDFIGHLRKDIALDRFTSEAPPGMVIAPAWGLKPSVIQKMIDEALG